MPSKLRDPTSGNYIRPLYPALWYKRNPPHLLYANLDFSKPGAPKGARRLLVWLDFILTSPWPEERTLRYLRKHQAAFRECLKWVTNGSHTTFDLSDVPDDLRSSEWIDRWPRQKEVQFFQQHCLDHAGVVLQPMNQDDDWCSGLELQQKRPRDPLDPICWNLLSYLIWDGTTHVRCCEFAGCGKFFRPRTLRKQFCSDLCRAKNHMSKKTRKQKRDYMRELRATKKAMGRRRKS